jgi:four helix bundle protein
VEDIAIRNCALGIRNWRAESADAASKIATGKDLPAGTLHASVSFVAASGTDIRERSFRFGCRIVSLSRTLSEAGGIARLMTPQLLRAGTALYPMLEEARAAESTRDFISKCTIGLKEGREAHGRLRLHEACGIGPADEVRALHEEANELVSIVTAIVRNTRQRADLSPSAHARGAPKS